jgi:RND superfamily putative drug exporter
VYAPGGATPTQVKGFTTYYTQTKQHLPRGIASIGNPIVNSAKDVALVTITPTTGPNDPATTQLINRIRQVATVGQEKYGLQTFVTGQTALNVDISAKLSSALPLYLAVIIILCVVILLLVFRSLLVPITAVAGYVLSVLAAFGAVTFVFQEGHFDGLFAIASPQPVLSFLPIVLLGILFGLAMDYEVFLVSRMREEFVHEDATAAVADGYVGSAKVVASAAIIMISVFASFIFSPDPTTKSLGFGLALGVLIDAFVIRMTVIPATMYLYGRAAWWLPRFLDRALPDIDIEGQNLDTKTG